MAMVHLRVICPDEDAGRVQDALRGRPGVVGIIARDDSSSGWTITADLARECADAVLQDLDRMGVGGRGLIALEPMDAAFGALVERAERDAPGEAADALIWDELTEQVGEDSELTRTFAAFMVLATLLASIGVVTDSQITIVGAMVVGPEFGPLSALAVALVRRRRQIAQRAAVALVVGFAVAIVIVALLSLLARATGLISPADLLGGHRETEFIYHPGWFSLITALVAGAAGMLSLISTKSAVLVGVFISVTTIPAAGNAAVAGVLGAWHETWQSVLQLAVNLVGITVAATVVLAIRRWPVRARAA